MKYIKKFESQEDENTDPDWKNKMQKFHQDMTSRIRISMEMDAKYNFVERNKLNAKAFLDEYLFTPKFRAGVYAKYNVDVPKRTFLSSHLRENTDNHYAWRWTIKDNLIESRSNFILEIMVEIPKIEQFRSGNEILKLSLYIKPNNRRKHFYELYNHKITPGDYDGNFLILADMIERFGNEMNDIFKIENKLSNRSVTKPNQDEEQTPE